MRGKLRLHLEDLAVDTFDTAGPAKQKGTVFGEQCTCYTQCTCPGCPTCANYNTCDNTCPNTCAYTCDDASCGASCNGTCDASCNGGYSCYCNNTYEYVDTCFNIGTCNPWRDCMVTP